MVFYDSLIYVLMWFQAIFLSLTSSLKTEQYYFKTNSNAFTSIYAGGSFKCELISTNVSNHQIFISANYYNCINFHFPFCPPIIRIIIYCSSSCDYKLYAIVIIMWKVVHTFILCLHQAIRQ